MHYELRTYHIPEGRMEEIVERFRSVTCRLFAKYDMEVVGFWTVEKPAEEYALIYLMRYADSEAMARSWEAFRGDPEWIATRERTEANGPIVGEIESRELIPSDFSPLQ